jgi:putative FmdB family regulatory protein
MPEYLFKCWDCKVQVEAFTKRFKPPKVECPKCGKPIEQDYRAKNVSPEVFNPYVETNMAGIPITINTKAERETLCDKYKVTYDSWKGSPPARIPWEKDLTWHVAKDKATIESDKVPLKDPPKGKNQ